MHRLIVAERREGGIASSAMASYVFARICDERHQTYERALDYIADLVEEERYYTRHEPPPKIMRRTPYPRPERLPDGRRRNSQNARTRALAREVPAAAR